MLPRSAGVPNLIADLHGTHNQKSHGNWARRARTEVPRALAERGVQRRPLADDSGQRFAMRGDEGVFWPENAPGFGGVGTLVHAQVMDTVWPELEEAEEAPPDVIWGYYRPGGINQEKYPPSIALHAGAPDLTPEIRARLKRAYPKARSVLWRHLERRDLARAYDSNQPRDRIGRGTAAGGAGVANLIADLRRTRAFDERKVLRDWRGRFAHKFGTGTGSIENEAEVHRLYARRNAEADKPLRVDGVEVRREPYPDAQSAVLSPDGPWFYKPRHGGKPRVEDVIAAIPDAMDGDPVAHYDPRLPLDDPGGLRVYQQGGIEADPGGFLYELRQLFPGRTAATTDGVPRDLRTGRAIPVKRPPVSPVHVPDGRDEMVLLTPRGNRFWAAGPGAAMHATMLSDVDPKLGLRHAMWGSYSPERKRVSLSADNREPTPEQVRAVRAAIPEARQLTWNFDVTYDLRTGAIAWLPSYTRKDAFRDLPLAGDLAAGGPHWRGQPRDRRGRWADTPGAGGVAPLRARTPELLAEVEALYGDAPAGLYSRPDPAWPKGAEMRLYAAPPPDAPPRSYSYIQDSDPVGFYFVDAENPPRWGAKPEQALGGPRAREIGRLRVNRPAAARGRKFAPEPYIDAGDMEASYWLTPDRMRAVEVAFPEIDRLVANSGTEYYRRNAEGRFVREPRVATEDARPLVAFAREKTGLPTNWSGRLTVGRADFVGAFGVEPETDYYHDILLSSRYAEGHRDGFVQKALLHESLHTLSPGLDKPSYLAGPGWEEAIVEGYSRHLWPELAGRLSGEGPGLPAYERMLDAGNAANSYDGFVTNMEYVMRKLRMPPGEFYPWMLRMNVREREGALREAGRRMFREEGAEVRMEAGWWDRQVDNLARKMQGDGRYP